MKRQKLLIYFSILIVLIIGCTVSLGVYSLRNSKREESEELTAAGLKADTLGSPGYVKDIENFAKDSGNNAALERVMIDVKRNRTDLRFDSDDTLRLYRLVCELIGQIGYVSQEVHYFRNELNSAPASLDEMIRYNSNSPPLKRWLLVAVKNSLYHMQGPEGIYNLKFVSPEGFCEAVYNRHGKLLNQRTDPVNMGTFNYGYGIKEKNAHSKYDVDPYLEWGNTKDSPQKGAFAINDGVKKVKELYAKDAKKVDLFHLEIERKNARRFLWLFYY